MKPVNIPAAVQRHPPMSAVAERLFRLSYNTLSTACDNVTCMPAKHAVCARQRWPRRRCAHQHPARAHDSQALSPLSASTRTTNTLRVACVGDDRGSARRADTVADGTVRQPVTCTPHVLTNRGQLHTAASTVRHTAPELASAVQDSRVLYAEYTPCVRSQSMCWRLWTGCR